MDLGDFARDQEPTDVEGLRARLRKMSDAKLLEFGKAAAHMCSPQAQPNRNSRPREAFLIQLAEARAEWRRRELLQLLVFEDAGGKAAPPALDRLCTRGASTRYTLRFSFQ